MMPDARLYFVALGLIFAAGILSVAITVALFRLFELLFPEKPR